MLKLLICLAMTFWGLLLVVGGSAIASHQGITFLSVFIVVLGFYCVKLNLKEMGLW